MNTYTGRNIGALDLHTAVPGPDSPRGMTFSESSSKTSSLRSFGSDDENGLVNVANFEDIGLEDEAGICRDAGQCELKPLSESVMSPITTNRRRQTKRPSSPRMSLQRNHSYQIQHAQQSKAGTVAMAPSKSYIECFVPNRKPPLLTTQFRDTSTQNLTSIGPRSGLTSSPKCFADRLPVRTLSARSASAASHDRCLRSLSPHFPRSASANSSNPRRMSWQSNRNRMSKSTDELEKECDEEDDDENIPDDIMLDNVPITPRPATERVPSRPTSASTSPERRDKEAAKDKMHNVGNGTPAVAVAHGSLRSPSWRSELLEGTGTSPLSLTPLKGRAKSWNTALEHLSAEAKALTEKLEEHADEQDKNIVVVRPAPKARVKSALAELPALRRTNIMIDPLPISKEKEAVLSRTRPSWLPPKDPTEEKKHLKQYQQMVVNSIEADKRREAARRNKEKSKDVQAESTMRAWEDVLDRWNDAIRERKTRDLWWRGIPSRSRGIVWARAIGNDLGLSATGFHAALARAREVDTRAHHGKSSVEDERRKGWFKQMREDVDERTWPGLNIFQSGGPLHQSLLDVLFAYAMYRSDIGYVAGCNTIAATLLLNLPSPAAAFITLANLLNRPLPLSFHASDRGAKASAYNLLMQILSRKCTQLHHHLTQPQLDVDPEEYLSDIFTAMFTRHLSLDEVTRLWDAYVFEGDSVLVRAAVALIVSKECALLGASDVTQLQTVLFHDSQTTVQGGEDSWMSRVRDAGRA